jgi:hypothetical protein
VTLPLVVILALVLSNAGEHPKPAKQSSSGRALPPLTLTPPPPPNASTQRPCTKLLTALPIQLGELAPRVVHPRPDSPFVVAWGDPAVVLRCGVARPSKLTAGSSEFVLVVNGVDFFQSQHDKTHVFTAIDRAAYIEVQVPHSYAQPPLGALAVAIATAMPPVCVVDPAETDQSKLCTYRK